MVIIKCIFTKLEIYKGTSSLQEQLVFLEVEKICDIFSQILHFQTVSISGR